MRHPYSTRRLIARSIVAAAVLTLAAQAAIAQLNAPPGYTWRIGAYGGMQLFEYNVDIRGLPGIPSCCPEYTSGSGTGAAFGISAEYPLVGRLSGGLSVLYSTYNGSLEARENQLVTSERDTVTAVFGHTITVTQPAFIMEAVATYETLPRLTVLGGARCELMLGGTYHQREEILSPGTIRFENDRRERLVSSGSIPQEASPQLALVAGARYDIPLNHSQTLLISPEVQVWKGLTNLVTGDAWEMQGLRMGLTLYWLGPAGSWDPTPLAPGHH